MSRRVLIISGDRALASELELALGPSFELHSAASDEAARLLTEAVEYDTLVADVRTISTTVYERVDIVYASTRVEVLSGAEVVTTRDELVEAIRRHTPC